jgi:hypothetical protein
MILTRELNDGTLIQHYSDQNYKLLQNETGLIYFEPIDVIPCPYTYTETDERVEILEDPNLAEEATIADYQDGLRELGVEI